MLPLRQEAPRLRPWRRPSSLASSGFRLLEVEPVADMPRVDRPRCGAVVTMVPWAEPGSRFTRDSESECTWLIVLLQCLFDRFGSVFPQCGLMVFPGVVIVSR